MLLKIDPSGIRVVVDAVKNKVYQIDEIELDGAAFNIISRKVTAEVGDGADLGPLEDRVTTAEAALVGIDGDVAAINTRIDFVGDGIADLNNRIDFLQASADASALLLGSMGGFLLHEDNGLFLLDG